MFRVFHSPFSATFLKGGFGLLGLVALAWALQQDVRSPNLLRGQATPVCGNHVREGSEQCDDGSANGVECSNGYTTCNYCTLACTTMVHTNHSNPAITLTLTNPSPLLVGAAGTATLNVTNVTASALDFWMQFTAPTGTIFSTAGSESTCQVMYGTVYCTAAMVGGNITQFYSLPAGQTKIFSLAFTNQSLGGNDIRSTALQVIVQSGGNSQDYYEKSLVLRGQATSPCGNRTIDSGEECDDGNTTTGDGCSASCTIETGWACYGTPSICSLQIPSPTVNVTSPPPLALNQQGTAILSITNNHTSAISVYVDVFSTAGVTFNYAGVTQCMDLGILVRCATSMAAGYTRNVRTPYSIAAGQTKTISLPFALTQAVQKNVDIVVGSHTDSFTQIGVGVSLTPGATSSSSANCWPEGWIDAGGKPCCAGLTSIVSRTEIPLGGGAIACNQTVAGNVCAACGNGTCNSQYENRCNCPGDCGPLPGGSSSASPVSTNLAILNMTSYQYAAAGSVTTYEVYITNGGPNAATNVSLDFTFPAGFTFVPSGSSTQCTSQSATWVRCRPGGTGAMAVNANATFTIKIQLPSTCNTLGYMHADLNSPDIIETFPSNNADSRTTTTTCSASSSSSSSAAGGTTVCGNGIKETGEDCKEPGTGTCTSPQECIQCKCQLSQQIQCGNLTGHTGGCWHVGGACSILCQPNNHVLEGLCDSQNNCFGYCGNNKLDPGEACDRGDPSNDTACTEFCTIRSGWTCTGALGSPSTCTQNPVSSVSSTVSVNDQILDDADAGFMSYMGTWAISTSGFRGGQHVHAPGPQDYNTPLEWGGWGTTVATPGDYKVYVTWVPNSSYSGKVTYEIDRSIGLVSLPSETDRWTRQDVSQKAAPQASFTCNGKNWVLLGNVSVTAQYRYLGIFAYAENTAPRNSQFAIDAAMIVPASRQPTCVNTIVCGNGVKESGEACDDGDTDSGDGCSQTCAVETGWACTGSAPSICTRPPACGNSVVETGEQCEQGRRKIPGFWGAKPVDLNGDGKMDLVGLPKGVAAGIGLRAMLGNGDGTFQTAQDTSFSGTIQNYQVGDFNGDGHADVIVASTDRLVLFPGNGNGTFGTPIPAFTDLVISTGYGIQALQVADVNGDNATDVLVTQNDTSPVRLYMGGANFAAQTSRTFTAAYAPMLLADFDRDGKQDLAYAESTGSTYTSVKLLYGNGDGTFASPVSYSVSVNKSLLFKIWDVNNDDLPDVLFTSQASGSTSYYALSRSDRTWQPTSAVINTYAPKNIADVNGDGFKDLLECSYATCGSMSVKLGRGDGTYGSALSMSIPYGEVADFNGDGRADFYGTMTASAVNDDFGVYITPCAINQLCSSTCQCAAAVMTPASSSSSSSTVSSAGPTCGNGQSESGETCDYASSNTCPGGQMCSASCSCVACTATGTPVEFEPELGRYPDEASIPDVVKLDATHALVVYFTQQSGGAKARVVTINGGNVTLGTAVPFGEAPSSSKPSPIIASAVDATHAIIAYPSGNQCKAVLATVNGNTVSFSAATALFQSWRGGSCDISFDGTTIYRRFDTRVIEKGVATITGNQISWQFTEADLFMNSVFDRVPMGGGKDMRLLSWSVMTQQRWPVFAHLLAQVGNHAAVAICNQTDEYCNCYTGSANCEDLPAGFVGGKIIPVGGNQYQIFTRERYQNVWKVTHVTVSGTSMTLDTPVDLADFSFGTTTGSIPALATGRFFVDVHPEIYGVQWDSGFLRFDVGPTGGASLHTSSAGTFLSPTSYVRAYKEGGYPSGKLQVLNQCTAAPSSSSAASVGWQSCPQGYLCTKAFISNQCELGPIPACQPPIDYNGSCGTATCQGQCWRCLGGSSSTASSSAASSAGRCGNGQLDSGEQCDPWFSTLLPQCGGGMCNPVTCQCPGGSSSSASSLSITVSSSSQAAQVCGNGTLNAGEQCELGVCCASGYSCDTRTCQCTLLSQVPTQGAICGNFRIEAGEDCENGISTPQLPCSGTAICDPNACRCPTGTARCPRWRSLP